MRHLLLTALLFAIASSAAAGPLRVGAARIDITPAPDAALPMAGYASRTQGFRGIHDPLYVRAIVLDDGASQVALVAWESLYVPDQVWAETSQQIAKVTGIRAEHVLLSAVHNHAAPTLAPAEPTAQQLAYRSTVQNAAVDAVRRAKMQLQPARFGIGRATAYVNINRREFADGRGWWLGFNEEGPSDKTVTVLRFEDLTGRPIALWINYPVHAVVMGPENYQITGDIAGATSQFVERHYAGNTRPRSDAGMRLRLRPEEKPSADGVVAVWASGAAGDQNPISMASGEDFTLVDALGKVLGEAAVRATSAVKISGEATLRGVQKVVSCPGRRVDPGQTPRAEYTFKDADPVGIRLSLLTINDVALAGVSGEVFTLIAQRLQRSAPSRQVVMVTHSNGSSG
ncbi:MAG TPA: neutral/alkaline non-lysosomal ceramidase N-terminal domain-containing protein, partial [Vicinamibacterales bacterium]|nr:neutral/alkaline non-lysosomal ceramidase N-terminal domain-containing protein [Vicinamibacterales bacterium]